jgi:hypothetical protein
MTSGSRVSQKPYKHEIEISSNFFHSVQTELQYSAINVMHFSLLRIKGLCMFQALLAHPQEALHK